MANIVKNEHYLAEISKKALDNQAFRTYLFRCITKRLKYTIRYNADGSGLVVNVVGHFQTEKGLNTYKHISVKMR